MSDTPPDIDEDVAVLGTRRPARAPRIGWQIGADGRPCKRFTRVAAREHGKRIKHAIARQR